MDILRLTARELAELYNALKIDIPQTWRFRFDNIPPDTVIEVTVNIVHSVSVRAPLKERAVEMASV